MSDAPDVQTSSQESSAPESASGNGSASRERRSSQARSGGGPSAPVREAVTDRPSTASPSPGPSQPRSTPPESSSEGKRQPEGDPTPTAHPARSTDAPTGYGAGIAEPPAPPSPGSTPFTLDRVIRFLLGVAAVGVAGWLLWYFAGLVVYLVVGGLFAYLLRPVVDRLQGIGLGRVPAIFVTFLGVVALAGSGVTSVVPFIGRQISDLTQLISVEVAVDTARYLEEALRSVFPIEDGTIVENVRQLAGELRRGDLVEGERIAETVNSVVAIFTNILYAAIVVPFVTFFLLKDGVQIRRSLLQIVPNRFFEITLAILDKVEVNIGRYFRALLVQSSFIALIASSLLWIVGLQNAVAIGIFTGIANTIPYFGPFLGFIIGSLVGVGQTGDLSLIPLILVAMGLTQVADNVLLQPLIFSRAAQAHPLVILFVVLVGAQLGGIVGMLIAIPLATTIRVVASQILWSLRNYRILRTSEGH